MLVLVPTRELAGQVQEVFSSFTRELPFRLKSMAVHGGVSINPQMMGMNNVNVLVATPGRLLELWESKALHFDSLSTLVLDEADKMLNLGFKDEMDDIFALLPKRRQNLLFSATFSKDIKKLAAGILRNPVSVETAPQNSTAKKVTHSVYKVDKKRKTDFTIKLIKDNNWNQVLIFTRTKHGANKLTQKLIQSKISAAAIHGNKSQGARTKALKNFKENTIKILVATDIAARGLDIPLLPHVINYELPNVPEDYVHRIGRTGRAGAAGEAISLVCSEETEYQNEIEKLLKEKLNSTVVEGFEPTDTAPPKRASTQSKGSFGKKKKGGNSGSSNQNKPKRKPNFKGRKPTENSGRGRRSAPKKKRY